MFEDSENKEDRINVLNFIWLCSKYYCIHSGDLLLIRGVFIDHNKVITVRGMVNKNGRSWHATWKVCAYRNSE